MSAKYNMATWFNISAICRFLALYLDLRSIVGSTTAAEPWRRGGKLLVHSAVEETSVLLVL
jgi:hypothetical protein